MIVIPGRPVPKGRPRSGANGRTYTPARTRNAEERVALLARQQWGNGPPLDGRVGVAIDFYCTGWCGDGDNLEKLVLDALVAARIIKDDRFVYRVAWERHLCARDEQRTEITCEVMA